MITLGIETSCDETSVAIVRDTKKILSNVVATSLYEHKRYGGVVPEIASRAHLEMLPGCLERCLKKAKLKLKDIDLIAVTQGPGLMGSLIVGISAAKALALSLGRPLIGVNHVIAHLWAALLSEKKINFPFLGIVASGGHTMILKVESPTKSIVLGKTMDDAIGEAFDKVAKILGLGYPGGPEIDRLSRGQDANQVFFTRPYLSKDSLDFSFSGIKTAVYYKVEDLKKKKALSLKTKKSICAGFQEAVLDVLVTKALRAFRMEGVTCMVLGGGVVANSRLRQMFALAAKKEGARIVFPENHLSQDNAAMIASFGAALYFEGERASLELSGYSDIHEDSRIIFL